MKSFLSCGGDFSKIDLPEEFKSFINISKSNSIKSDSDMSISDKDERNIENAMVYGGAANSAILEESSADEEGFVHIEK